jgi:hypothetical protein
MGSAVAVGYILDSVIQFFGFGVTVVVLAYLNL